MGRDPVPGRRDSFPGTGLKRQAGVRLDMMKFKMPLFSSPGKCDYLIMSEGWKFDLSICVLMLIARYNFPAVEIKSKKKRACLKIIFFVVIFLCIEYIGLYY